MHKRLLPETRSAFDETDCSYKHYCNETTATLPAVLLHHMFVVNGLQP